MFYLLKKKGALLFSAALLSAVVTGCGGSPEQKYGRHIESGQKFFTVAQYSEAAKEFKSALLISPESAEGHYRLGLSLLAMGGPSNSIAAFKEITKAVDLAPSHQGARLKLAELYLNGKKFDEAQRLAQSALEDDGTSVEGKMILALASAGKKDYSKALEIMERLLEATAPTVRQHMVTAGIFISKDEPAKAEGHLQKAITIGPKDIASRIALANLYFKEQRLPEAESVLKKAAEELKDDTRVLTALANFYINGKRYDDAESTLQRIINLKPGRPEGYMMLVEFYKSIEKPGKIEETFRKGIEKSGDLTLKKKVR